MDSIHKFLEDKRQWLQGVDPGIFFIFRIVYGLFMAYEMIDYIRIGLVKNMFFLPALNFKYDFLGWLKPLPEGSMNILLIILLLCTICITLGILFRWACRVFAVGYLYIFLLDKSIYNNHIYLFILLAILFSLTDADKGLAVRIRKPKAATLIPRWQVFVLQVQIVIVYFYGGIAKLTYDWMVNCQPVRFLIQQLSPEHFLAPLLKNELAVYTLNYGGLLLDLLAPLLLWYKPVRRWAIFPFIIFHLTNSRIFTDIGIFPYLMLFALILFYELKELPGGKWISEALATGPKSKSKLEVLPQVAQPSFAFRYALVPYFIFQLLFPFRGHFLPNDLDWTTIGNRFSWRMKVDTRQIEEMKFWVVDPATNENLPVDIQSLVNDMQILNLSMDPRSVADFAKMVKAKANEQGIRDARVKADIKLIYNRRPPQYFVDPGVDLATVEYSPFTRLNWVYPLNK